MEKDAEASSLFKICGKNFGVICPETAKAPGFPGAFADYANYKLLKNQPPKARVQRERRVVSENVQNFYRIIPLTGRRAKVRALRE